MSFSGPGGAQESPATLASLRQAGADQFDPVQFHFLETLAQRTSAQAPAVRRLLDGKLAQAMAVFAARLEQAQRDAHSAIDQAVQAHPHAAAELHGLCACGDFGGARRLVAKLEGGQPRGTLADLARHAAQAVPGQSGARWERSAGARPELKSVQYFRDTWSKLSAGKRVTQAFGQAPKNAGPINSHMVVLRSLALMRDISPDYLNRFMSYVDALLCLEQVDREAPATPKAKPDAARAKAATSRRARPR